ncbi:MAG TPA: glycolate oxidase subunit GlcE [Caulobacteraceae bacterium]
MPISIDSEEATEALAARVREATRRRHSLKIIGANSKAFLGRRTSGRPLDLSGHRGVIAYEPSELVITARSGTRIDAIERLLAKHDQKLAFEPPNFGGGGTLGGMVAAGLSGPSRPFVGAVRDFVLGVTVMDGRGRSLRFGGTVFKNVAGFDAFRLMSGAMGCLGVLLDVSLRVTPRPRQQRTLAFNEDWPRAQGRLTSLLGRPLPVTGAFHDGARLYLRLSGTERAVAHAASTLGGDKAALKIWNELRHMRHPFFAAPRLWRLSVPRTRSVDGLAGDWLIDWAGAQRWLVTPAPDGAVRDAARAAGGHATLFHGVVDGEDAFEPLSPPLMALHQRLKAALDPAGVFNRGRMYEGL